jgi:hypothetical protein
MQTTYEKLRIAKLDRQKIWDLLGFQHDTPLLDEQIARLVSKLEQEGA